MYTINTQLAYFKYNLDSKKLIVNIKWFKLDKFSNLNLQALSFNKSDLELFKSFIAKNKPNFPGSCFVEQTRKEGFDMLINNELSQSALPYYLILSKNPKLNLGNSIYQAEMIILMNENYQFTINYTLDFDVIGKIEVYKQVKE
ncbi:hypothetical protein ASF10_09860 [Flavobacterium sp. Leaf82]|uniref:Uncharacterized protein n=2 Tax=Flavobacterium TaxID=237 RepID=A0A7W7J0B4_9FLAO|nr:MULTISPECIES: hypothetical protein [Flavobacterium]KQO22664.1 hypothetical protein ASF10_09860 [Flavobacterium sp. Leaf82]MBB4803427.1 hypothetical protein [Flavobacterium nitrogenifigens]MBB6388385.1 hypothetical protein [Flavobacterium notoginsengisoli]PWB27480.1 hypothetical protein DCO46_02925 [Flavobacterium sp. HTF]